jgi:hypothetical protein
MRLADTEEHFAMCMSRSGGCSVNTSKLLFLNMFEIGGEPQAVLYRNLETQYPTTTVLMVVEPC